MFMVRLKAQPLMRRDPLVTEVEPKGPKVPLVLSLVTLPLSVPSLHNPLAAFAPPHHQGSHEEGDQDGNYDEGTQDAVGWVSKKPPRQRAIVEVFPVDSDEELVHKPVGPVTLHLVRHQGGAVCQLAVESACW